MNQGGFLDDFRNVWNKPNNAVAQLILINAIAFVGIELIGLLSQTYFKRDFFGLPADFGAMLGRVWTWITYQFVHEDFFHILFNMLWFYWFGRLVQEFLGSQKVVSLYLLGGFAGGLAYMLAYNFLPLFTNQLANTDALSEATIIGASAGVSATVVGAAVFMPNYTFFMLFLGPVRIKYIALVVVILWLLGVGGANGGGQMAHLGGAALGWLYIVQLKQGNDWGKWIHGLLGWVRGLFVPSARIKVTHRSSPRRPSSKSKSRPSTPGGSQSKASNSNTSQEEIDAILDKISQSGYESLSKEEKQKLFNASK